MDGRCQAWRPNGMAPVWMRQPSAQCNSMFFAVIRGCSADSRRKSKNCWGGAATGSPRTDQLSQVYS